MSKRKENPPLADWEVTLADSKAPVTVPASWWRVKGGHYRFYGETGVVHDFAPWTVTHVRRVDGIRHSAEHEVLTDGRGAHISRCSCGRKFASPTSDGAFTAVVEHVRHPDGTGGGGGGEHEAAS